jgi:hypothetical protein
MTWKLKLSPQTGLIIPALLLLVGCNVSATDGVRVVELPSNVVDPCDHPAVIIQSVPGDTVGADEIRMGRLGDALIECGNEKDIAVDGYEQLADILR